MELKRCKHCLGAIKRHDPIRSEDGVVLISFPFVHFGTRRRICLGVEPVQIATPMTDVDEVDRVLTKYYEDMQVLR